jgi:hypothetical protein
MPIAPTLPTADSVGEIPRSASRIAIAISMIPMNWLVAPADARIQRRAGERFRQGEVFDGFPPIQPAELEGGDGVKGHHFKFAIHHAVRQQRMWLVAVYSDESGELICLVQDVARDNFC